MGCGEFELGDYEDVWRVLGGVLCGSITGCVRRRRDRLLMVYWYSLHYEKTSQEVCR